jgi:hypothetical protein
MRNFRRSIVLVMFFCLVSSWTPFSLGQGSIELVAWEKLADFIVDIPGWDKKGDLEGFKVEVPPKSEAWQGFVSKTGKRSLEIHIFDSAESMMILMPIKMMMNDSKTSQGYTEKITIHGFPGAKIYDNLKKEAGLIVLILDRFVLQMFGHYFTEEQVSELVKVAENHDLKGIAELGK